MEVKPLKTITPLKAVAPVKPVVPVTTPVNKVEPVKPVTPSVTEVSKEDKLKDVKSAVNKVQNKAPKEESKEAKTNKEATVTSTTKRRKTASEREAENDPVIREDETTKTIDNKYTINLLDYKGQEDKLRQKLHEFPGNVLVTNIETDEIKSLEVLWKEGKIATDLKLGEYVLAIDIWEDAIYKIFVKDIIEITVNTYYDDVRLANPTKLGEYYHVYHRGRRVFDRINKKTFDYLVEKGHVKQVHYCTIDAHTRLRFFGKKIGDITDTDYNHEKIMKIPTHLRSRMTSQSFIDEAAEEGVNI